jgi:hypothetical protein
LQIYITQIARARFSRIPLYETFRANIKKILFTKTLLPLSDHVKRAPVVRTLTNNMTDATFVDSTRTQYDMLNYFQTGITHLAVVVEGKRHPEKIDQKRGHAKVRRRMINITRVASIGDFIGYENLSSLMISILLGKNRYQQYQYFWLYLQKWEKQY